MKKEIKENPDAIADVNGLLYDALANTDGDKFANCLELLRPDSLRIARQYHLGDANSKELVANAEEKALEAFKDATFEHIYNPKNYFLTIIHNSIRDDLKADVVPDSLNVFEAKRISINIEGKPLKDDAEQFTGWHIANLKKKRIREQLLYKPHPKLDFLMCVLRYSYKFGSHDAKTGNLLSWHCPDGIKTLRLEYQNSCLLVDTMPGIVEPEVVKRYLSGYKQVDIATHMGLQKSNVSRAISKWIQTNWGWDTTKVDLVILSWLAGNLLELSLRIKKEIKADFHQGLPRDLVREIRYDKHSAREEERLINRIAEIWSQGKTSAEMWEQLVAEGWSEYKFGYIYLGELKGKPLSYSYHLDIRNWLNPEEWKKAALLENEHGLKRRIKGVYTDELKWGLWEPKLRGRYSKRLFEEAKSSVRTRAHLGDLSQDDWPLLSEVIRTLEKAELDNTPWRPDWDWILDTEWPT